MATITDEIVDGTLIKDFPLAETVNDDDDMIIESALPQTEHIKALTFKNYVLEGIVADILDVVYPVGSIYTSKKDTSPAELFGGEWTPIEDVFLLAAGSAHDAGETGGTEAVTLSEENLPTHTHSIPAHTHSIPALSGTAASAGAHTHTGPSHTHSIPALSGTAASAGEHSHSVNYTPNAVASGSYAGRLHTSGSSLSTGIINSAGAHTHSVTTNASTTGSAGTGTTGSAGSHTHTVTTTASTTGSASGTSGETGDGEAFATMPPYMTVYVWERTA